MPRNLIRHIHILDPWNVLHGPQPSHSPHTPTRRPKQVIQHPIIPCKRIHEPPRNNRPDLAPGPCRHRQGRSKQKHILHDPKRFLLRKLMQRVKYHSCSEGEPNQCNGPYTKVALDQDFSQNTPRSTGTVECVAPRVIDQVSQFGENCCGF